ncbi:TPA: rubrerythrin family protein [Candidatus Poribacteria bacterium]|nr:rubrerythrin family protein [Candidatus Poribacteria bacterium]
MKDMTASGLRSAFGGESQAHIRYRVYANKAERDGFKNVARLFTAISFAEWVHAQNHFRTMRDVGGDFAVTSMAGFGLASTSDNLQVAINGEAFEVNEMYPAYRAVAELQEEKRAHQTFDWALKSEMTHAALYQKAKESVDAGQDPELDVIQVCDVCGHTLEGDAPEICPVCNAKNRYVAYK